MVILITLVSKFNLISHFDGAIETIKTDRHKIKTFSPKCPTALVFSYLYSILEPNL